MRITWCRICDSLCTNWSSIARCASSTSSRTCDLKASWISLSDSRRINNASKSKTSSAKAWTRGSSCWAAHMLWYAIVVWTCTPKCEEECAEHDSAEFCTLRCTATSMLLTELRTRWCLRPSRRWCEAKKGVQRHPHRRNCPSMDYDRVWCIRG